MLFSLMHLIGWNRKKQMLLEIQKKLWRRPRREKTAQNAVLSGRRTPRFGRIYIYKYVYTYIYILSTSLKTERNFKVVSTSWQPEMGTDDKHVSNDGFVLVSIDFRIQNPPCGSCQKTWELKAISQNANAQSQHSKPMYTNSKRVLRDVTLLQKIHASLWKASACRLCEWSRNSQVFTSRVRSMATDSFL